MLAACGGGGGSSGSAAGSHAAATPANTLSKVAPACLDCAASSPTQYAGQGVGIWEKTNSSAASEDVPVYIDGLQGQGVTLVFSKGDDASHAASMKSGALSLDALDAAPSPHEVAQEFNRAGRQAQLGHLRSKAAAAALEKTGPVATTLPALNDSRSWHHTDQSTRQVTLVAQRSAADGMVFNVWVENGYFGDAKVRAATVQKMLEATTRGGGIYDSLVALGGPMWGPHAQPAWYLPAGRKWIDIVLLDFRSPAMRGYFWGLNNYLQDAASASNESLAIVLDTSAVAAAATDVTLSDVAHELMHLQNYYRRTVSAARLGSYETWLEEMTAMMAEDHVTGRLNASFNSIREGRLPTFLAGNYNCPMLQFTAFASGCESYSVAGSFGGYLLRQHGGPLFKDLLYRPQTADSLTLMDQSLAAGLPSSSFALAFRRFAVSADALLRPDAPSGYGFPQRSDAEFPLVAIDPARWAATRRVPSELPPELASFASVPLLRASSGSFYSEVVRVPPGVTLSVVIH